MRPAGRFTIVFNPLQRLMIVLLLLLTACGATASAESSPPKIHYGEDVCEFCGMIISEERFAAAFVTGDGHGHIYDDIGDMVEAHLQLQEDVTAFFVHDHEHESWVRAEEAYFVHSEDLPTPMLSGLAAFTTEESAQVFAAKVDGRTLTFDALLAYYQEKFPPSVF